MCFSLLWLKDLLIWLVVIAAVIAIIRLFIPWVTTQLGLPIVGQVLNIVLWAVVVIVVIMIVFALLQCLLGGAGTAFPKFR